jgi:hypothetical protein
MPCEGVTRKNATHRFSMGIHRHQIVHFHDDVWENWTSLTRSQRADPKMSACPVVSDALWKSEATD